MRKTTLFESSIYNLVSLAERRDYDPELADRLGGYLSFPAATIGMMKVQHCFSDGFREPEEFLKAGSTATLARALCKAYETSGQALEPLNISNSGIRRILSLVPEVNDSEARENLVRVAITAIFNEPSLNGDEFLAQALALHGVISNELFAELGSALALRWYSGLALCANLPKFLAILLSGRP